MQVDPDRFALQSEASCIQLLFTLLRQFAYLHRRQHGHARNPVGARVSAAMLSLLRSFLDIPVEPVAEITFKPCYGLAIKVEAR